jgi:hypothetical protein
VCDHDRGGEGYAIAAAEFHVDVSDVVISDAATEAACHYTKIILGAVGTGFDLALYSNPTRLGGRVYPPESPIFSVGTARMPQGMNG